jgi:hypothetical protein
MSITFEDCSDRQMMALAMNAAGELTPHCKTAVVMLTSVCKLDGHGNHTTVAVLNKTGHIDPRENAAIVNRLRSLADELEVRFGTDTPSFDRN